MSTDLQAGDFLPARTLLPLVGGSPVRLGSHGRRAQVVVVTHVQPCDQCDDYLSALAAVADRIRAEKAEVVAVVGPDWGEKASSRPVMQLVEDRTTSDTLSPSETPVVAVADRFGQLFSLFDAGAEHQFPAPERILATLLDIAIRCPECGVPDVPSLARIPEPGTTSRGMRLDQ